MSDYELYLPPEIAQMIKTASTLTSYKRINPKLKKSELEKYLPESISTNIFEFYNKGLESIKTEILKSMFDMIKEETKKSKTIEAVKIKEMYDFYRKEMKGKLEMPELESIEKHFKNDTLFYDLTSISPFIEYIKIYNLTNFALIYIDDFTFPIDLIITIAEHLNITSPQEKRKINTKFIKEKIYGVTQ